MIDQAESVSPSPESDQEPPALSLRSSFLAELSRAMQDAAGAERARLMAAVADDVGAHIETVRARGAIEADEMRRMTGQEIADVETWAASEVRRIEAEAARRIDDRRTNLADCLEQHEAMVAAEVDGVERAVRDYGSTLERFFDELAGTNEPADIVRRAERLPQPPDLDAARVAARAATTEAPADPAVPASDGGADLPALIDSSFEAESPPAATLIGMDDATATGPAEAIGAVERDADIAEPAVPGEPAATPGEGEPVVADANPIAVPTGVMDPDSTGAPTWPSEQDRVGVAAAFGSHTSPAVRLLRTVAPWTSPTAAGRADHTSTDD